MFFNILYFINKINFVTEKKLLSTLNYIFKSTKIIKVDKKNDVNKI